MRAGVVGEEEVAHRRPSARSALPGPGAAHGRPAARFLQRTPPWPEALRHERRRRRGYSSPDAPTLSSSSSPVSSTPPRPGSRRIRGLWARRRASPAAAAGEEAGVAGETRGPELAGTSRRDGESEGLAREREEATSRGGEWDGGGG